MLGRGRGVYGVLVGRPKGKRPLGRPRCRWEDNIKLVLRETGIDGVNWIGCLKIGSNGNEPSGSIKKADYCLTSFSKNIVQHGVGMYMCVCVLKIFIHFTYPFQIFLYF
jgi:hypothetical protein